MNAEVPLNIIALLKRHGLRAKKRLGQNFLQDSLALENIITCATIHPTDSILEIGAGLGTLTRHLARSAGEVIAVEVDRELAEVLQDVLKPFSNVRVVCGDILDLFPEELGLPADYIVVANIPYNITSAIIRHLLESEPQPRRIVLTIQQEVAQRICASPPDMSLLALSVQVYGKPEIVARVPAGAFFPVPRVDSAVVRIEILDAPVIPKDLLSAFFELSKAGFSQKRKTLRNSISSGLRIPAPSAENLLLQAGIDPRRRAETLSLLEWHKLSYQWSGEVDRPRLTDV